MLLLSPDNEEYLLMLSQIYLHYGVNLDEVTQRITRSLLHVVLGAVHDVTYILIFCILSSIFVVY